VTGSRWPSRTRRTAARDLAALTKRLTEVTNAIEAIDAREAEADPASAPEDEAFDPSAV
jgi:hypothetical protein